jgi:hypothetical protein
MRNLKVFAIPIVTSLVLALLLGIFTDTIRVDGSMSLVVALVASAVAAAAISMVTRVNGILLGAIGGASVVPIVLFIKFARWPAAPVLGDGADAGLVLFVAYFSAAVVGAFAGRRLAAA